VTYRLEVSGPARRHLHRLPEAVATAIGEFITGPLLHDPKVVGKPLHPPLDGLYSARRGGYRIIYRIDGDTVIILRVEHRADIYRA
jgi:mRNA interferase RelE/StbE